MRTYQDRAEYMRAYQNKWKTKRRLEWIAANGPCKCGSAKRLCVVYKNPKARTVKSSNIWSLSPLKQSAALRRCMVLCLNCLRDRTNKAAYRGHCDAPLLTMREVKK